MVLVMRKSAKCLFTTVTPAHGHIDYISLTNTKVHKLLKAL